jgi:hypothetical protein
MNGRKNRENAFQALKQKLLSQSIPQYTDFSKELISTTDASNEGAEAILSQGETGRDTS